MSKFAVAVFDGFEGSLINEIVEADSKIQAIFKLKEFAGRASDFNFSYSEDDFMSAYFCEDVRIVVTEIEA